MSAEVKEGDKRIVDFYTDLDLTAASSIKIEARRWGETDKIILPHTIEDAVTGHLTHKTDGVTLTLGLWQVEVVAEWNAGADRVTFPSDDSVETIEIVSGV